MLKEFKEFAMRGNVLDMAVGVIIGGAFGKIVSSMVSDILMPPLGLVLGKVDFSSLFIDLSGTHPAGAPTINYGVFLQAMFDFLIVAFVIFMLIKQVNRLMAKPAALPAEPTTKECPRCYSTISIKATKCAQCTSDLKAA